MKKYISITVGLFAFLCMFSCKTKKVNKGTTVVKEQGAEYLVDNLIKNQVKSDWFSSRIKLNVEGDKVMNVGLSGTLRMEKDKAIWVSLKKFGFEVARALITPDSAYVVDRIGGNNIAEDIGYVQRKMNFPANFQMLQAIVLGNPVFFTKDFESKVDSTGYTIWSETSSPKSTYLLNGENMNLKAMAFEDFNPQRLMKIFLEKYELSTSQQNFSHERYFDIRSNDTGDMKVKLQFSNVEFDVPKKMPFTKPKLN